MSLEEEQILVFHFLYRCIFPKYVTVTGDKSSTALDTMIEQYINNTIILRSYLNDNIIDTDNEEDKLTLNDIVDETMGLSLPSWYPLIATISILLSFNETDYWTKKKWKTSYRSNY